MNTRNLPRAAWMVSAVSSAVIGGRAMAQLPPVPVPAGNPITEPKRVLGKLLFWEEQMSMTNTMSCGTCHSPARGGTDGRVAINNGPDNISPSPDDKRGSPGVPHSDVEFNYLRDLEFQLRPQVTDRSANSMINAAFAPQLFWDGRASGQFRDPLTNQITLQNNGALESQSVNPPVSSVEMGHDGIDWTHVASKLEAAKPMEFAASLPPDMSAALVGNPDYPELFRRAFGDPAITPVRIAFAIATYERTLIADDTPWDRFQAGNQAALTPAQAQGFQAFQQSNCNLCHIPPLFTGNGFRNIGLRPPAEDLGLQNVTNNPADRGKFKVPGLRNVGLKTTFMHNGQFNNLTDLIRFYARAPGAAPQFPDNRDPIMNQVNVPPQAAVVIEDFLRNGLTDARVAQQTFPFDRPTLTSENALRRSTPQGGGVPGSGGLLPWIVADMPPILGYLGFRVGLDQALGGATAKLGYSFNAPVNGRITPVAFAGEVTAAGVGNGQGLATLQWHLSPKKFAGGQVIFLQWFVTDAAAAGGEALSDVLRVPIFCGSSGCATACTADYNDDGFGDAADYDAFIGDWLAESGADVNGDGFSDALDYDTFIASWLQGC